MYFLKIPLNSALAEAGEARAGGLLVLDPATWVGRPFPLFDEIDGSGPLRGGRWLVVMYHYDCDDCRKAIPDYQTLAVSQTGYRVAFVAIPPFAAAGIEPVAESEDYPRLRLREDHDWFATTPVVAVLENGRVLAAAEGQAAMLPPEIPRWGG